MLWIKYSSISTPEPEGKVSKDWCPRQRALSYHYQPDSSRFIYNQDGGSEGGGRVGLMRQLIEIYCVRLSMVYILFFYTEYGWKTWKGRVTFINKD